LITPKAIRVPPKEFPVNYNDPSKISTRNLSPGSVRPDIGPSPEEHDMVAESQASAFAAVDQSILPRRVGLPEEQLKPIPLDLAKKLGPMDIDDGTGSEQHGDTEAAETEEALPSAGDDEDAESPGEVTVSVSHILTNVIIFQSFLLELASLMQVRASLFDEVRYV
jgi:hypothetical protein